MVSQYFHHFFAFPSFISATTRPRFLWLLYTTAAIRSKYSECIYRIIGKVVVMHIVHLIYILLLYVLCRTMVFLKVLLSTWLEAHKAAIHIFNLFKSNVVKIFSLNGTQSAHGRICSRCSV